MRLLKPLVGLVTVATLVTACGSTAATTPSKSSAPKELIIGTLYASSGSFATSSMPEYNGLRYWIKEENAKGGAFVAAYHKRIPLKLIAYNDQSSPATATTLYNQLVTQDKVNIFVSDFGSVLTAPAVAIAQEHHVLLFDQSGSGASFFTPNNPYIVLTGLPTSAVWPTPLTKFLLAKQIKKVAIVYGQNDFNASQEQTIVSGLAKAGIRPVYNQSIPTATTNYGSIITNIAATHPDAVLELGYPTNDIAFLQNLQASGKHFKMVFTIFPGQLQALLVKNVGQGALAYTYTYGVPPVNESFKNVNIGLSTSAFVTAFQKVYPGSVSFLSVIGYNTGLVVQAALGHASSLSQLALRNAVAKVSGKLHTLDGTFAVNSKGAQVGEFFPVSQLFPSGTANINPKVVYPSSLATTTARYPAPTGS